MLISIHLNTAVGLTTCQKVADAVHIEHKAQGGKIISDLWPQILARVTPSNQEPFEGISSRSLVHWYYAR